MEPTTIKIDDIEYVRKDAVKGERADISKDKYVIVRTRSAGVFAGFLKKRDGDEVTLRDARRLWRWFGASLSEIAMSGTPDKSKCKFPEPVDEVLLIGAFEILAVTPKAKANIESVEVWKA